MAQKAAKKSARTPRSVAQRLPQAPAPRPAQGFSSSRAQKWVMGSALITALIYAFRRMIEPSTPSLTATTGRRQLAGTGSPPSLERWATAYGATYLMLAMLALGAPELAATLAMMAVIGNLLLNGLTVADDLAQLEAGGSPQIQEGATPAQYRAQAKKAPALADKYIPQAAPFP